MPLEANESIASRFYQLALEEAESRRNLSVFLWDRLQARLDLVFDLMFNLNDAQGRWILPDSDHIAEAFAFMDKTDREIIRCFYFRPKSWRENPWYQSMNPGLVALHNDKAVVGISSPQLWLHPPTLALRIADWGTAAAGFGQSVPDAGSSDDWYNGGIAGVSRPWWRRKTDGMPRQDPDPLVIVKPSDAALCLMRGELIDPVSRKKRNRSSPSTTSSPPASCSA